MATRNLFGVPLDYGQDTQPQENDPFAVASMALPTLPSAPMDNGGGNDSGYDGFGFDQMVNNGGVVSPPVPSEPTPPSPTPAASPTFSLGGGAANNLYGGQTYAGFDPQNHQGANLNDPMNAKYALMDYLANNGGLTQGNAPAVVAALNARYGGAYGNSGFFRAVDGETIMMPDGQYVHYAPNGYGMAAGTYNPGASSEVFWGASGSPDTGGGGSGGGGTSAPRTAASGGGGNSTQDNTALLQMLGSSLSPPGNPAPFGTDLVSQIGQDPLSQLITGGIGDLIANRGATPDQADLMATLKDLISRGGRLPDNIIGPELESARETESAAFTAQLNDARAELANRGILGVPGAPQGAETDAIARISQNVAGPYSTAIRDINTNASKAADDRLTTAIATATGLSASEAANYLSALGAGTNRQTALGQLALQSLSQNQQWNEFLAQFGLTRDQVMYQIASGQSSALVPLLNLFASLAGLSAGGAILSNTSVN